MSGSPGPKGWLSLPNPIRGGVRPRSAVSARERSSGTVTLRLSGSPGIAWTGILQASSSAASSVNSGGALAGLAGAVYAFSKGSISPATISIAQSTDGLIMVLLGGVETLTGPIAGAAIFTWLRDEVARRTEVWRAVMGGVILLIVLLFPQGIVGGLKALWARRRAGAVT